MLFLALIPYFLNKTKGLWCLIRIIRCEEIKTQQQNLGILDAVNKKTTKSASGLANPSKGSDPESGGEVLGGLGELADSTLVQKVANGEQAAYSVLVLRHSNRHLMVARRILSDQHEAEDALQDAFISLWKHASRFDPQKAKFSTWFYRIVTNQCLDRKRKKKPGALPEGFDVEDKSDGPQQQLAENQRGKTVRQALDKLPGRQKVAITLCYFEGVSNKEAAEILELNIKALESLLTRARKALAKDLSGTASELLNP